MEIYLLSGEEQTGPFADGELCTMVTAGHVMRSDLAWHEGMADWLPLEQVIALPPRPSPPPVPKATAAPAAGQPFLPSGLPPLPPKVSPRSTAPGMPVLAPSASTIRTVSGVIALILGLLTIFNVGGCVNAHSKLTRFQSGDNALDGVDMLVDTARGVNEGDPLRGVSGLLDKAHSLQDDYEGYQTGAWLCLIGTGVAAGVFRFSRPVKTP